MAYKEILLPWGRQPQGEQVRPHQRWLDKGLVYADLLTDPRNTVTDSGDTVTGTKVATAPWGLSRGFGTTVGVASTDRIQTTLSTHPVQRTWILRNVRTGTGGGNLGRFFDVSAVFLLDDNSTSRYQFGRAASSVNGFWQIAFPANGVPGVVAVSYDETTGLSAVPSMYLDGIKRTLLAATQPTGTLTAKTGSFVVGNSSAGNRNYNGRLSDFLVFDSILSDGEIAELADPSRVWEDQRIWVPVSAGGAVSLTVADASHGHTADNLTLTTSSTLVIQDATHAHTADSVALSTASVLTVADATHAHSADSLTLTTASTLSVADAAHAHAADSLTLTTAAFLAIADATHGQAADSLTLTVSGSASLTISDATHAHTADALALTTLSALAVADASHAHAAESVTLSTGAVADLIVQDATHGHTADSLALVAGSVLTIDDAIHAQNADNVGFVTESWLVVADAVHVHRADNVTLVDGLTPIYAAIPASRIARGGSPNSRPAQLSTGRRR